MCRQKMAFCTADVITWGIRERMGGRGQFNYNFLSSLSLTRQVIHFRGNYQQDRSPACSSNSYGWAVTAGGREGETPQAAPHTITNNNTPKGMSKKKTTDTSTRIYLATHLNPQRHPGAIIIKITAIFDNYDLWWDSHCISHRVTHFLSSGF